MLLACAVALIASSLTLFTGFGLGTLLLPALALNMPVVDAVAVTALVHLLNNLFKAALVGRWARRDLVLSFGLPAMLAAVAGSSLLAWLGRGDALDGPHLAGWHLDPTPADLVVGLVIVVLALRSLRAARQAPATGAGTETGPDLGPGTAARAGLTSGFIGGLTGHQGAVRSAYLIRLDLDRDTFVGTGVAIACLVDLARLAVYRGGAGSLSAAGVELWLPVTLCAFAGAWVGARLVRKTTLPGLRRTVGVTMAILGCVLAAGLLG